MARIFKEAYQLTDNLVYLAGGVVRRSILIYLIKKPLYLGNNTNHEIVKASCQCFSFAYSEIMWLESASRIWGQNV